MSAVEMRSRSVSAGVRRRSMRAVAAPENGRVYSWAESARDAMVMKGFDKVRDWSVERQLWLLEVYNGLGYRLYHGMASPYLWAGTNHYSRGKYVGDGKFSAVAVSKQAGAAGLLRELAGEETKRLKD